MHAKPLFAGILALALAGPLCDAEPAAGELTDIVYGQTGGHDLKLDLYLPAGRPPGKRGWPVVLYLHSGGWRIGSKAEAFRYARLFTDQGIAVASANYRLSGEAIWPAQILDAKTAVRWLHATGRRYDLDPARIGAFGTSAGAHLVALLGTTAGVAALEDRAEGSPGASDRVRAVCEVSGPVDITIPTREFIGRLCVRGEFGGSAAEKPDLVRQADPSRYVHGGEPPFLIIQGDADKLVVPENARKLDAALRAHGDDVSLDMMPGGKHIPLEGQTQLREIAAFFKKHLG